MECQVVEQPGIPGPGSASPEFTALENSDRQRIGGGRVWARGGQCLGRDRANAIPLSRNLGVPPVENTRTAKVWTALRRMVSMSSAATDGEFHVWPSSVNSESQPLQSLPASNVCRLVSKTFKDSAGSAPDTWWPPDLQNVSQGRCGRQAGRQVGKKGGRGALGSWCRHPDGATGARLHPTLHCTRQFFFYKRQHSAKCRLSVCRTRNLCSAGVCHWKCTSASVEPDLKVTLLLRQSAFS